MFSKTEIRVMTPSSALTSATYILTLHFTIKSLKFVKPCIYEIYMLHRVVCNLYKITKLQNTKWKN